MNIRGFVIYFSISVIAPYALGQDYEQLITKAVSHIEKKDYEQAVSSLLEAKEITSNRNDKVKIDNSIGWVYYLEGNNKQAEKYLLEAFKGCRRLDDPDPSLEIKISNNLGILYFTLGDLEKSKEYFQRHSTKENEIAVKYLDIIKAQEQKIKINTHIRQGVYYSQKLEFDNAVDEYDKALKLSPNKTDEARALEYKGYALFMLEKYDDSLKATEGSLKLDPENINAYINLMKVYCAKGDLVKKDEIEKYAKSKIPDKSDVIDNDTQLPKICNPLEAPGSLKVLNQ